jgi:riboflavin synthase
VFTGIVEEMGAVLEAVDGGGRLTVRTRAVAEGSAPGASVAVSGVCLTVVANEPGPADAILTFDLSPETLARSTLGRLRAGDAVNLERPVTPAGRLGGHLVQGHVDGIGVVEALEEVETGREIWFELPDGLERYVVEKGSITVDGVSLTATAIRGQRFGVALVPHTLAATTLGRVGPGDGVNLEVDVIARYVERLLGGSR